MQSKALSAINVEKFFGIYENNLSRQGIKAFESEIVLSCIGSGEDILVSNKGTTAKGIPSAFVTIANFRAQQKWPFTNIRRILGLAEAILGKEE